MMLRQHRAQAIRHAPQSCHRKKKRPGVQLTVAQQYHLTRFPQCVQRSLHVGGREIGGIGEDARLARLLRHERLQHHLFRRSRLHELQVLHNFPVVPPMTASHGLHHLPATDSSP